MRRSIWMGGSGLVAAAAIGGLVAWMDGESPGRTVSQERVVPAAAAASAPWASGPATAGSTSAPCEFAPGERLAYGVTLTSSTQTVSIAGQAPMDVSLSLSGRLELEALESDGREAVLVGRLDKLSTGATAPDAQALERPFLVKVDTGCRLVAFARQTGTPRRAARNVQALLWEAQFEATASDVFRMENGNGVAVGRMEIVSPQALRRTLSSYASLWRERGARDAQTEGTLVVRRGAGPWFETLDASEDFSFGGARTTSRLSLTRGEATGAPFTEPERAVAGYVWENLLPEQGKDLISRPVTSYDVERRARVAGQTPSEAIDAFVARKQQGVGIQETWPDLAAYFEVHPETIAPSVARYLAGELPLETTAEFFLALGKARVPAAREALLTIKRDESRVAMDRVRSMFALVLREDVGPAFAAELSGDVKATLGRSDELSQFLAGEALLALSMMSGARADAQVTEIAQASVSEALTSRPNGTQLQRAVLGAVGNLGMGTLLAASRPYYMSSDRKMRRAATRVFGRVPPIESEPVALEWLEREDDALVKRDLWDALQQQHFDSGKGASRALVDVALRELPTTKSAYTRRAIIRLLVQSEEAQAPDVRQALVRQAKWERANQTTLLKEFQRWLTQREVGEVLK